MYKLIQRTKECVRQVDRQNFKKLQKMLMGEDEGDTNSDTASVSDAEFDRRTRYTNESFTKRTMSIFFTFSVS